MSYYDKIKQMDAYELSEFIVEKFKDGVIESVLVEHCEKMCPMRKECSTDSVELDDLYCHGKSDVEIVKRWLTYDR